MTRACAGWLLLLWLPGCFDFGYRVRVEDVAGDAAARAGGDAVGGACVEGPTDPSDSGPQVSLITLNVDRPVIVIAPGDVVTWTNTDSDVHTVTAGAPGAIIPSDAGGFDSGNLASTQRWAYRFCDLGTWVYFCQTHPQQMNGYQVVIEE